MISAFSALSPLMIPEKTLVLISSRSILSTTTNCCSWAFAGQRHFQRHLSNLLEHFLGVSPVGPVRKPTATAKYRGLDVALSRPARAFLPVELATTALDVGPMLDGCRARPSGSQLCDDDLVQDAFFHRNIENRIFQFGLRDDFSGDIYYINNSHNVPRPLRSRIQRRSNETRR
jgi:hypothetical protein